MIYLVFLGLIIILGLMNLGLLIRLARDKRIPFVSCVLFIVALVAFPFVVIAWNGQVPFSQLDAALTRISLIVLITYTVLAIVLYVLTSKEA